MEAFSELVYLQDRCTQEFQMAQKASDPAVARPHYSMAIAYHEKAHELSRRLSHSSTFSNGPK
ncbi:MAG TPA: hypothetical protein VF582_06285 [Allosphingosinicella sp.]|jgi:hypothetical protein